MQSTAHDNKFKEQEIMWSLLRNALVHVVHTQYLHKMFFDFMLTFCYKRDRMFSGKVPGTHAGYEYPYEIYYTTSWA